jgi:uncharacterized HAD superfamily protein
METFGKHEQTFAVRIKLFLTRKSAEKYCQEASDNVTSDGFWQYAELIDEGTMYELKQAKNIKYDNRNKKKEKH